MKLNKFSIGVIVTFLCFLPDSYGSKSSNIKVDEMVRVPDGEFWMGCNNAVESDSECSNDSKPYHKVYLDEFYIDKYEVTVEQYRVCVNAGKCSQPSKKLNTPFCNWRFKDRGNHPINCVNWNQAKSYCLYAGKRLPTEAEWEKAARGTNGRKYPWGNKQASCSYAIMNDGGWGCGRESTWPVGSKPSGASPYGAMDMAGNVEELSADWYDSNYYKSSPSRNPRGPATGYPIVYRGGSWVHSPHGLRASQRGVLFPTDWDTHIGFRCAKSTK